MDIHNHSGNNPIVQNVGCFKDFSDLINSESLEDVVIHSFMISLLKRICGKSSGEITIDSLTETEENHKLIRNNWKFIQSIFNIPNRIKNNQKLVKQTLKYIMDDLNQRYSFSKPIELNSKKISTRTGKICSSYVQTTLYI
jgi:hypothetical protein